MHWPLQKLEFFFFLQVQTYSGLHESLVTGTKHTVARPNPWLQVQNNTSLSKSLVTGIKQTLASLKSLATGTKQALVSPKAWLEVQTCSMHPLFVDQREHKHACTYHML
jgi:hypothetical protein